MKLRGKISSRGHNLCRSKIVPWYKQSRRLLIRDNSTVKCNFLNTTAIMNTEVFLFNNNVPKSGAWSIYSIDNGLLSAHVGQLVFSQKVHLDKCMTAY